jgi:hypothetical protein
MKDLGLDKGILLFYGTLFHVAVGTKKTYSLMQVIYFLNNMFSLKKNIRYFLKKIAKKKYQIFS